MTVFEKIEIQQKGHEDTDIWMVGEQLKDICRSDAHCEKIVAQDLENKEMSIMKAAEKIKAYADKQPRKGKCVCVPPNVAEQIIREFYGLPGAPVQVKMGIDLGSKSDVTGFISLGDLLSEV